MAVIDKAPQASIKLDPNGHTAREFWGSIFVQDEKPVLIGTRGRDVDNILEERQRFQNAGFRIVGGHCRDHLEPFMKVERVIIWRIVVECPFFNGPRAGLRPGHIREHAKVDRGNSAEYLLAAVIHFGVLKVGDRVNR